jgi:hypothetical protein
MKNLIESIAAFAHVRFTPVSNFTLPILAWAASEAASAVEEKFDFGKVLPIFTIGCPVNEAYCLPYAQFLLSPAGPQGTGGAFLCRLPCRRFDRYPSGMGPNRQAQERERAASVIGAALAALIGIGGGQALASAGCDAVNAGGFNGFFAASSITIGGFMVGDGLTFTLVAGGADWRLENGSGGTVAGPTGFSGVQSYTVTGVGNDTTLTQRITIFVPVQAMTVKATCVAAVSGDHIRLQ